MGPMPYCEQNMLLDAAFPSGSLNYWTSNFIESLSDETIREVLDGFARAVSPMNQVVFEHFHGRAVSVPVTATAFPHRRDGFNMLVISQWLEPADTDREIQWARDLYKAMQPFYAAGRYINYQSDVDADVVAAAYGPNYARLRAIKGRYDPDNLFHVNQNIAPAATING